MSYLSIIASKELIFIGFLALSDPRKISEGCQNQFLRLTLKQEILIAEKKKVGGDHPKNNSVT